MTKPDENSHISQLNEQPCAQLVDLSVLRQHEEVDPVRLEKLKEEIRSDGVLKLAIAVDRNTKIILDGEHRCMALKELGCRKIPVVFLDYNLPEIEVQTWRKDEYCTKRDVIEAGFSDKKFPPKTTKHIVEVCNTKRHISAIEKRVDIPLEKLR